MSELNTAATNIYNRLLSAPTFHPASADLFTDWNMQAGDVVTVKSDSDSYQVPIYNMKLKWTGAPKVEVESTGNPEREPLPAIKRREYSANSSNYKEQKSLRGGVGQAQSGVREINGVLYAAGLQIDPVTGVWLYASEHGADYALGATFKVQSDAITSEVSRATTAEGTLSSQITQTADAIRLKVSKGDVATQLSVECGNVTISGGNLVVSGYITSQGLITSMGQFNGSIYASGSIGTPSSMSAKSITLDGESLTSHVLSFIGNLYTVAADSDINLAHYHDISASESNGVITITQGAAQSTAGTATFNIADTQFYQDAVASAEAAGKASIHLSSSWNANNDRLTTSGNTHSMSFLVGANAPVITYKSTTHKYHATAQATVDGTVRGAAAGADSGTEAYNDGFTKADAQYSQASYAKDNLSRFNNGNSVKLYYFTGSPGEESSKYRSAGQYCWFYSNNSSYDTLYTKSSS